MDASILATLYLKELGVREIVVKALSADHGKVLALVGATEIVHPERDTAERVARGLGLRSVVEFLPLAPDSSLLEMKAPPEFVSHTLGELQIRRQFQVLVVAIRRGDTLQLAPGGDETVRAGDVLVLVGRDRDLEALGRRAG
jgi:trk system potassium uptake protein TrkA